MTCLTLVAAAELVWIALPGGAYFAVPPLTAALIVGVVCLALWQRIQPVWWLCVLLTSLSVVQLTLGIFSDQLGVTAPWAAFAAAKLVLLLGEPVRRTVRRTYEPPLLPA